MCFLGSYSFGYTQYQYFSVNLLDLQIYGAEHRFSLRSAILALEARGYPLLSPIFDFK